MEKTGRIYLTFVFFLLSRVVQAQPPPHAGSTAHTSLIPSGIRVDPDKNPFPYIRSVDTEKESCTGFDIGCGFVLTAGHCNAEKATINSGVKGDQAVAKAVRAYSAPGWKVPNSKAGWTVDGGDNFDVKLVKVESSSPTTPAPRSAQSLIDWNMRPFVVDPKRPVEGWIAGYGATNAVWDEKKQAWIPYGPAGELAWGKVSLDYSGYYSAPASGNFAEGFGTHRNGMGRICSEPRAGLHGVINGDSGGPLIGPDGKVRGVIASFARERAPDATSKTKYDYVSCYVDLAGHLPWIYETLKADGCSTLPVVPALDRLKSPPGVLVRAPTPTELPPPTSPRAPPAILLPPVAASPQRDRELAAERAIRKTMDNFRYDRVQAKRAESLRSAETLREMARRYRERRPEYEDEARKYDTLAKAYDEVYPTIERGKINRTYVQISTIHPSDRDELRASVGALVAVPPGERVSFGPWARYDGDTITLSFGFCPTNRDLKDCKFEERGVVTITPEEVRAGIRHTVR